MRKSIDTSSSPIARALHASHYTGKQEQRTQSLYTVHGEVKYYYNLYWYSSTLSQTAESVLLLRDSRPDQSYLAVLLEPARYNIYSCRT